MSGKRRENSSGNGDSNGGGESNGDAPDQADLVQRPRISYELGGDEEAPILAIRHFLKLRRDERIPHIRVRLGTTRGTNALLTRRGARVGLVTTRGFRDLWRIGHQNRPHLFELDIEKPPPLSHAVVELDERVAADGSILLPLDLEIARQEFLELSRQGIDSIAICLMNAYVQPEHERQLAEIARELDFAEVSVSSELAPLIKLIARGDTTMLNAYLNPILHHYLAQLRRSLGPESELRVLSSAGGLLQADSFRGKDSILSGPAGGVVGFSRAAAVAGFERSIGFDMGGTSTDVSRFDRRFEWQYEAEKAGVRIVTPMLAIETVAAGGGSICDFEGTRLTVGPDSAGADPGPACYGRGGPLTVTDLNLLLGRILPDQFPFPLDQNAAERRLDELQQRVQEHAPQTPSPSELAEGLLRIANTHMARAIRGISVARGYDPRDYVLVAFGGAAPQHACAVAEELGMHQVLIHPHASLLSAYGVGTSDIVRHRTTGLYEPLDSIRGKLPDLFSQLESACRTDLAEEEGASGDIQIHRTMDLRFQGLEASISVDASNLSELEVLYRDAYERLHGDAVSNRPLEAVAARVEAGFQTYTPPPPSIRATKPDGPSPRPLRRRNVIFAGKPIETPLYLREEIGAGHRVEGPALIIEPHSTIVVAPGWQVERLTGGEMLLERTESSESTPTARVPDLVSKERTRPDPIALEIFHHLLAGIAEQMGLTLRNTSSSVNVKERLDFSCALFTSEGDLIANAPHIPVHLGAMSETVKAVLRRQTTLNPGDVFVTNDPYEGGSHLPDITVVTPIFAEDPAMENGQRLVFFTASRAHHAEIGGIAPGSMPPGSTRLGEEGVVLRQFPLFCEGRPDWEGLRSLLLSGPHPTRHVEHNLADIRAQVAANRQGAAQLLELAERFSLPVLEAYTRYIQEAAEQRMRAALGDLPDGRQTFTDYLDDGSPIAVTVTIQGDEAEFDFTGTGPVLPNNLNANRAIVTAAVMYSLRCLLGSDIPLNQGVLGPVRLQLPTCLLNPTPATDPSDSPAVAGGNVETSQRVVDVILGALQLAAASQGTMNNLSFGNAKFGYYETICGGAGATPRQPGASAVHTHMTNTRLTDPEVLEQRFPVRVREFSIRAGSGGQGARPGGDGVVRRLEFLAELEVSLLSQRRGPHPPFGLAGGDPGALGSNQLRRKSGEEVSLRGIDQFSVQAGDVLTIRTPGGGGHGRAIPS